MDGNGKRCGETGEISLVVRTDWSTGPRTPAWDRSWGDILSGLDAEPIVSARQEIGREDGDG